MTADAVGDDAMARAFALAPAALGYWDRDMRNVVANEALRALLGVGDVTGQSVRELVRPLTSALAETHIQAALAGRPQHFTRTLVDGAGNSRHLQIALVPDVVDGAVVGVVTQATDLPDRSALDRERDESLSLLATTMEYSPIGKAVVTTTGRWLDVNRAMCALLGYTSAELMETSFAALTHPDDVPASQREREALMSGTTDHIESEARLVRKDGSAVWVHRHATIVRSANAAGEDIIIAQAEDITHRKSLETALTRQASTDSLTGLGNRRMFVELLARVAESGDREVGLIYLDLDDFKRVNDTHGHTVGDELLVAVADRIGAMIGVDDTVSRIGGDEFVVLVHSARTADDLERQRVRLKKELGEPYTLTSTATQVRISVSAGSSWAGDDPAGLLRIADERMYRDKSGRPR